MNEVTSCGAFHRQLQDSAFFFALHFHLRYAEVMERTIVIGSVTSTTSFAAIYFHYFKP